MADELMDREVLDQELDLTGRKVGRCIFERCRLTLNLHPTERTELVEVILIDCEQIGEGWAYVDVEIVSV